MKSNTLRVCVSRATTESDVREDVISEMEDLVNASRRSIATTLLMTPDFTRNDFLTFQAFCEDMEQQVEKDVSLRDEVVLVWFHPEFRWSEIDLNDVVNFEKRAPYPTINILRANELDEHIEKGNTAHILELNEKKLKSVGPQTMKELYHKIQKE